MQPLRQAEGLSDSIHRRLHRLLTVKRGRLTRTEFALGFKKGALSAGLKRGSLKLRVILQSLAVNDVPLDDLLVSVGTQSASNALQCVDPVSAFLNWKSRPAPEDREILTAIDRSHVLRAWSPNPEITTIDDARYIDPAKARDQALAFCHRHILYPELLVSGVLVLASSLRQLGDNNRARNLLQACYRLCPTATTMELYSDLLDRSSYCAAAQGNLGLAVALIDRATATKTATGKICPDLLVVRGLHLYHARNFREMRASLHCALDLKPTSRHKTAALQCLAAAEVESGNLGGVETLLDQALDSCPDKPLHRAKIDWIRGRLLSKLKRLGDAAQVYERVIPTLEPLKIDQALAIAELAAIELARGNSSDASTLLSRLAPADAEDPRVSTALQHLENLKGGRATPQQIFNVTSDIRCYRTPGRTIEAS